MTIDFQVMQFARCALGAIVFEGFGSTETTAICTTQIPGDLETGSVGHLLSFTSFFLFFLSAYLAL